MAEIPVFGKRGENTFFSWTRMTGCSRTALPGYMRRYSRKTFKSRAAVLSAVPTEIGKKPEDRRRRHMKKGWLPEKIFWRKVF